MATKVENRKVFGFNVQPQDFDLIYQFLWLIEQDEVVQNHITNDGGKFSIGIREAIRLYNEKNMYKMKDRVAEYTDWKIEHLKEQKARELKRLSRKVEKEMAEENEL